MAIGKQTEYTVILVFPSMFFSKNFVFLPNFIIEAGITTEHHVFSSWTELIGLPVRHGVQNWLIIEIPWLPTPLSHPRWMIQWLGTNCKLNP